VAFSNPPASVNGAQRGLLPAPGRRFEALTDRRAFPFRFAAIQSGLVRPPVVNASMRALSSLTVLLTTAFLVVAGATGPTRAQSRAQPTLPTVKLTAGIHVITAEAATTPLARTVGLMHRERLAPNHGMLFVFEEKSQQCFWMRNTLVPLTIAFIEDDGTIAQFADMAPRAEVSHCSQKPVRFALEMEQGWFAKRGIAAGARIGGLPSPR
jgi:uncharacterized protein